jgi:hypothetical protein
MVAFGRAAHWMATALVGALVLGACAAPVAPTPASDPTPVAGGGRTQVVDGGQVTVRVSWAGPSAGPVFDVTVDTHAVDLDGYDLTGLATLRLGDGRQVAPTSWEAPRGGHHRIGKLAFPAATADGKAVLAGPGSVELVIRDIAGVPERAFKWTL